MDALAEQVARLHTQAAVADMAQLGGRWRRHRPSMLPPRRCGECLTALVLVLPEVALGQVDDLRAAGAVVRSPASR